ncbi:MAG: flagellar motor stator protein MotA, partial [Rhodocyclaceae bacterium]|nr:flagellar motor stator protein MotA [Rhodocyclaceae bacterium]
MFLIIGYVIVLAASLGTYAVHGSLAALWVPTEYIAIVGLMIGGFVASNGIKAIKSTVGALPSVLKGSAYNKAFYVDVLALMYELLSKVRKEGLMSIEGDIENAEGSPIFSKYPNFLADHHAVEFLTDYLRMMVGGNLNAFEIENLMDMEIETHHTEAHGPAHVMSKVADSVPAFGIVVAVMGVVNVMGSVGQPPAVLGKMIGGALVGTFLGILLAYGFVGPLASAMKSTQEANSKYFACLKAGILAHVQGNAPAVSVEFARKTLMSTVR